MSVFPWSRHLPYVAMGLLVGCAPSVKQGENVSVSGSTIALFAPDADRCKGVLPFPTDLAKDPVTHRLDLPYCEADTPDQLAIKTGLNTLDGFSAGVTLTTRFSAAIDPASLTAGLKLFKATTGEAVPFTASFDPTQENTLFIQPSSPLAESTTYFAVVTDDVKDTAGKAVSADKAFVFAMSTAPLVDADGYSAFKSLDNPTAAALEPLRLGLKPMFDALAQLGVTREHVAVAWAFTPQTVHASLPALAALVGAGATATERTSIRAWAHPLVKAAGIPSTYVCDIHTGELTLKNLITPTGTFGADASGAPVVTDLVVDYLLTTPNLDRDASGNPLVDGAGHPLCTTPWAGDKVLVFAHGLGRCKNDALALASDFGKLGFAVLTVDGPHAGTRMTQALGDADLDGCPDQPATPELLALPGASVNPFAVRDQLREWGLELVQISTLAKSNPRSLAGLTGGTTASRVALLGHSFGGMAAALAGSAGAPVDSLVVNAASAELGAVFTPSITAQTQAQLAAAGVDTSVEPGKTLLAQSVAQAVAAFRWAIEPADPLYAAPATTLPVLAQVVSAGSHMADAPLHATDTQKTLAAAYARAPVDQTTFVLDSGSAALCDDSTGVVGALLKPCVADNASANYIPALLVTAGLRRQAETFIATVPTGTPLVCDPSFSIACP